jgi:hypothetical protein
MSQSIASDWKVSLHDAMKERWEKYDRAKKNASKCYYLGLYGPIIFGAAAALVLKLNYFPEAVRSDWGAILATIAAILSTMMAAGDFDRRYRSARQAKTAVANLLLEIKKPDADEGALNTKLQNISKRYDDEIMDVEESEAEPAGRKAK